MNPGKVNKVEVKAGLGSGGDDQEWSESQRDRAVPKKAAND
jgi:hypothetical protein